MNTRIEDMGNDYERLFKVILKESVPAYLCERICRSILQERDRNSILWDRTRLVISSLTGASSLVGLAFALPALIAASAANGFSSFAGLFLSDSDVLVHHFGTFGMSLLETLPGFEVTVTLFLTAVFLVSLQNFVRSLAGFHTSIIFRT